MPAPFVVGIEIPSAELVAALGATLASFADGLERSGAAYAIIGADRAEDGSVPSLSPTVAGGLLARRTKNIGLVVAASPRRDHPYNIARRVASVDHVGAGRVGLLPLRRDRALDLGVGEGSSWVAGPIGAAELADAITAIRKLWRTWPIETLDPDPAVSEAAVIRFADHTGVFGTKGPLNSPTTPQGEPLVFWQWDGGRDRFDDELAAARSADVIIVDASKIDAFLAVARNTLATAAAAGQPLQIHVRAHLTDPNDPAVAAWRDDPAITGLALSPGAGGFAELAVRLLPSLIATLPASAAGTTLRDRLAIPRRREPDLSGNESIFAPGSKELA